MKNGAVCCKKDDAPTPSRPKFGAVRTSYYVYIMASRSRVLYTGVTNDLVRRVKEHKAGAVSGFTSKYRVNRLVHFEQFKYVLDAIAREKQIKGWLRSRKIVLIEGANPAWKDLAESGSLPSTSTSSISERPRLSS